MRKPSRHRAAVPSFGNILGSFLLYQTKTHFFFLTMLFVAELQCSTSSSGRSAASVPLRLRRSRSHCCRPRSRDVSAKIFASEKKKTVIFVVVLFLCRVVPRLFYSVDSPQQDPVWLLAKTMSTDYLEPIMHEWARPLQPIVHDLAPPFSTAQDPQV